MAIKCNFSAVFAQFESVEEVKNVANAIRDELINAFNARVKELGGEKQKKADVDVTVSAAEDKKGKQNKPAKKEDKKGAKKSETKAEKKDTKKGEAKPEKKAKKERERTYDVEQIALTDTKAVKKLGLKFIPYNDKCVLLLGETKPIAAALRNLKKSGVFGNGHLKAVKGFEGGFGWLVNKEHEDYAKVCKSLGLKKVG
jgi:hypothetical protein